MVTANLKSVDLSFPKIVYVNGYSQRKDNAKDSFFTKCATERSGKVLFNSRLYKIHSENSRRWIVVNGLNFSIVSEGV